MTTHTETDRMVAEGRFADVPADDARPWLIVTARNLMHAQHRREPTSRTQPLEGVEVEAPADELSFELELDPELARALQSLSDSDREALLLVAWEDLTPALAARSLGISAPGEPRGKLIPIGTIRSGT